MATATLVLRREGRVFGARHAWPARRQAGWIDRRCRHGRAVGRGIFVGLTAGVPTAVSVPLPAHRFYGREQDIGQMLLAWAARIRTRLPEP